MKRDEELAREHIMEILADCTGSVSLHVIGEALIKFNFRLYYGEIWKHCDALKKEGRLKMTSVYDSGVQDYETYVEPMSVLERLAAL